MATEHQPISLFEIAERAVDICDVDVEIDNPAVSMAAATSRSERG